MPDNKKDPLGILGGNNQTNTQPQKSQDPLGILSNNNTAEVKQPSVIKNEDGSFTFSDPQKQKEFDDIRKKREEAFDKAAELRLSTLKNVNDGERAYLKNILIDPRITQQEKDLAMQVMDGIKLPEGSHIYMPGTWNKLDHVKVPYYMKENENGVKIPVPLKPGQKPPKGYDIESVWGTQEEAEDDGFFTIIGKHIANIPADYAENIANTVHLPYGLAEGSEAEWYRSAKNQLESQKLKLSSASQKPIFEDNSMPEYLKGTEFDNPWGGMGIAPDLFSSKNWNFTKENVAGTIGSLINSMAQFALGGYALRAAGMSAKASTFAASYMTNLGSALDACDEAGIKPQDKYAIASLVTIPVSMVEMKFGIENKLMNDEATAASNKLISSLIKGAEKNGSGEISEKGMKELYEVTTATATKHAGYIKNLLSDASGEMGEEVAQNVLQKSAEQVYDNVFRNEKKDKGFGTDVFSGKSFADYINDAIAGFAGGAGPGVITAKNKTKADEQSKNAYEVVQKGDQEITSTLMQLQNAVETGRIKPEEYENAKFKIERYKAYSDALKDKNFDDDTKRRIFDLTFHKGNLTEAVTRLEKESNTDGILTPEIKAKKKQIADIEKEIESYYTKADVKISPVNAKDTEKKIQKEEEKQKEDEGQDETAGFTGGKPTEGVDENAAINAKQKEGSEESQAYKGRPNSISEAIAAAKAKKKNTETKSNPVEQHKQNLSTKKESNNAKIEKLAQEIRDTKIDSSDGFADVDLSDNSDFVASQRAEDTSFNERISTHEQITSGEKQDNFNKKMSPGQKTAIENLKAANILSDTDLEAISDDSSVAEASYAITEAVRRIQYLKTELKKDGSKEAKAKIEKFDKALKAISTLNAISTENKTIDKRMERFEKDQDTDQLSKDKSKLESDIKKLESLPAAEAKKVKNASKLRNLKEELEEVNSLLDSKPEKKKEPKKVEDKKEDKKPAESKPAEKKEVQTAQDFNALDDEDKFDHAYKKLTGNKSKQGLGKLQKGKSEATYTVQLRDGKFVHLASSNHIEKTHLPAIGEDVVMKAEEVNVAGKQVASIGLYNVKTGKKFAAVRATNLGTGTKKSGEALYEKLEEKPKFKAVKTSEEEKKERSSLEQALDFISEAKKKAADKQRGAGGKALVDPTGISAVISILEVSGLGILEQLIKGAITVQEAIQKIRKLIQDKKKPMSDISKVEKFISELRKAQNPDEVAAVIVKNKKNLATLKRTNLKEETRQRLQDELQSAGQMFSTGEAKMEAFKGKLRYMYTGINEYGKDEFTEQELIGIAQNMAWLDGKPFEANMEKSIAKLINDGYKEENNGKIALGARLQELFDAGKSEDMVSLFVHFRSYEAMPYYYAEVDRKGSVNIRPMNISSEGSFAQTATTRLNEVTEAEFNQILFELNDQTHKINKQIWKADKATAIELAKQIIDIQTGALQKLTGISALVWEEYFEGLIKKSAKHDLPLRQGSESLYEYYVKKIQKISSPAHLISYSETQPPLIKNIVTRFVQKPGEQKGTYVPLKTLNDWKNNAILGANGKGGLINSLSQLVKPHNASTISSSFKTPAKKRKSSYSLISHLTGRAKEIIQASKHKGYAGNSYVQWAAKRGSGMELSYMAGINNMSTKKDVDASDLSSVDICTIIAKQYAEGSDSYLQLLGQFGDKDSLVFVRVPKYATMADAKKKLVELIGEQVENDKAWRSKFHSKNNRYPNAEELKNEKNLRYKNILNDTTSLSLAEQKAIAGPLGGNEEAVQLFNFNNAINLIETNHFVNGKESEYKGFEDIIKRNGSTLSPGMKGSEHVEGGLGKGFSHLIINGPVGKIVLPNGQEMKEFKGTDGGSFILRSLADKINKSYGKTFNFNKSIKAITSFVDGDQRFLDKTNSVVIDDLATLQLQEFTRQKEVDIDSFELTKENINSLPYLAFYQMMKKTGTEKLSTVEGTKKTASKKGLEVYKKNSTEMDFDVFNRVVKGGANQVVDHNQFIPTQYYLVQQDLMKNHGGMLSEGTSPIQGVKNIMAFKIAIDIAKDYNELAERKTTQLRKELTELSKEEISANVQFEKKLRNKLREFLKIKVDKEADEMDESMEDSFFNPEGKDYVAQLVDSNVELDHPHIKAWLQTYIANQITNKSLLRSTNKALAVEIGNLGIKLRDMEVKDGQVRLGTVAVPANSKFRMPKQFEAKGKTKAEAMKFLKDYIEKRKKSYIDLFLYDGKDFNTFLEHEIEMEQVDGKWIATIPGEIVKYTRIPADDMHSHTFARATVKLPRSLGNHIITPEGVQAIAGSDNDGDQRTIQGVFKESNEKMVGDKKIKTFSVLTDNSDKGLANRALMKEMVIYYDAKNVEALVSPIDTSGFDEAVAHFKAQEAKVTTKESWGRLSTVIKARVKNNVGLKVVGAMANLQAAFDFLKAHDSKLKNPVSFPRMKLNGNIYENASMSVFSKATHLKPLIGNLLNMALDNVKDPRIETLGLNEITVNSYVGALMLGIDFESVATFFNHPVVRKYTEKMREMNSAMSNAEKQDMIMSLVKELDPKLHTLVLEEAEFKQAKDVQAAAYKSLFGEHTVVIIQKDINDKNSVRVLQKLMELDSIGFDFMSIQSVIRATEGAPKSFPDFYTYDKNYQNVTNNKLNHIDTAKFAGSPFLETAKLNLYNISQEVFMKFDLAYTETAQDILSNIEVQLGYKDKKTGQVVPKKLNKQQVSIFNKAINQIAMVMSRKYNGSVDSLFRKTFDLHKALSSETKYAPFLNLLEIKTNERFGDKLMLRESLRRNEIPTEMLVSAQKAFDALMKDRPADANTFLDYLTFQYGFAASKMGGSFVELLPISAHKAFGAALKESNNEYWENATNEFVMMVFNEIMARNPELIKDKMDRAIAQANLTEITDRIYNPIYVRKPVFNYTKKEGFEKFSTENSYEQMFKANMAGKSEEFQKAWNERVDSVKVLKAGDTVQSTFEGQTVSRTVKKVENVTDRGMIVGKKVTFEPVNKSQQQKESNIPGNVQEVVDKLTKAFKGKVNVVYDETLNAAGELSSDGKTIRINPNRAGRDTGIHEFAHVLIDAMGNNKVIAKAISSLKGTKLWDEIAKAYPNLSEADLGKEVLAEAIGRKGAEIFDNEKDKSAFRTALEYFFDWMKRKLGLEKDLVTSLAKQVIAGRGIKITVATGKAQQQQNSNAQAMTVANLKAWKDAIAFDEDSHTYSVNGEALSSSVTSEIDKLPDYKYNGPKNEDKKNNEIGTACHKIFEGIANGLSRSKIKKGTDMSLFADERVFDQVLNIMQKLFDQLSLEGEVLSEIRVASIADGIGGAIDIPVVLPDGRVKIYDIKTSEKSTEHGTEARDYRVSGYAGKAPTMEKHKIQTGTYGAMLEMGSQELGIEGMEIDTLNIVPIRITIDNNKITSAVKENNITFSYENAKKEVHRVLRSTEDVHEDDFADIPVMDKGNYIKTAFAINIRDEKKRIKELLEKKKSLPKGKEKEAVETEISDIQNKIDMAEKAYENYLIDMRSAKMIAEDGDIDEYMKSASRKEVIEKLTDLYRVLYEMDPLAKSGYIEKVKLRIAQYLFDERQEELKELLKDRFDENTAKIGDISKIDIMFKTLTHMTEAVPELQKFAKFYNEAFQKMLNERESFKVKGQKLAAAVIKDYNKKMGLPLLTAAGNLFVSDNAKYFSWMEKDGELIQNTAGLSEPQKEYLKWYRQVKKHYKDLQNQTDVPFDSNSLLKVDMSFGEALRTRGFLEAISSLFRDDFAMNNVYMKYDGKILTYPEIKGQILAAGKAGIKEMIVAIKDLLKYHYEAKRQIKKGSTTGPDGKTISLKKTGEFETSDENKLTSKFGKRRGKGRTYSRDFHEAINQYIDQMSHITHMEPLMPIIDSIEHFNTKDGSLDKPNVVSWIKEFKNLHLTKTKNEIGPEWLANMLKFLRKLTSLSVMAFNVGAAKMNLIVGGYNNFRTLGKDALPMSKGYRRLAKSGVGRLRGDWDKKAHEILTRYKVISVDMGSNPRTTFYTFFDTMAHGLTKLGEYIVQGGAVLSMISDEDYAKWNAAGEVMDSKDKSLSEGGDADEIAKIEEDLTAKILTYKDRVSDIQGKYAEKDRRNIMNSELGKFFMQFRVWIPDWWKERFGAAYVSYDDREAGGSFNKAYQMGVKAVWQQIKTGKLDDNMKKNLRGMLTVAGLMIAAGADDDDDDKGFFDKMLGDLLFILDPKSLENMFKTPLGSAGGNTVMKILRLLHDLFYMNEYKSNKAKWGDKGDLRAVGDAAELIPYNRLIFNQYTMPDEE